MRIHIHMKYCTVFREPQPTTALFRYLPKYIPRRTCANSGSQSNIHISHAESAARFIFEAGERGSGPTGSSSSGKCSAINYAIIRRPGRHIQFMTNCISDAGEAVPKDVGQTAVCPGHFHFVLSWL